MQGMILTMTANIHAAGESSPVITLRRYRQPLTWALILTLALIFAVVGFFSAYPTNFILWALSAFCATLLVILIVRTARSTPKIEASEVRRLVACQSCGVETEGPYQSGDYTFRTIGSCPRCKGTLYIKALYSVEAKTPLKRQKQESEDSHSQHPTTA